MKQLSKEQQKQIMRNLLQEQKQQAEEIIKQSGKAFSEKEKKQAFILIMRAINISNNFNVDTAPVLEDIKLILTSAQALSSLRTYTRELYKTADTFKETIEQTIAQGLARRKENNPSYPDFLQQNGTVFFAIENSLSAYQTIEQQVQQINEVMPAANRITYNQQSGKLEMDKQSFSVGAFFSRRKIELGKLLQKKQINFQDTKLYEIVRSGNYADLIELRKNRSLAKDNNNHDLIKLLGDKVLFYQISDLIFKQLNPNPETKLKHALRSLAETYTRTSQTISFSQQKGSIARDTLSIDTLIVSNNPHQIATQSEYKNWRNCTSANDFNHPTVAKGIGEGTIIVYGVNSHLPQKKISRILLTPYKNDNGEIVYFANRTYGEYNLAFKEAVEQLAENISSKEHGIYKINPNILADHAPERIFRFDNAEDFCKAQNLDYQKDKDGKIKLDKLSLSKSGFTTLPAFLKDIEVEELDLSFLPLKNFENCPQCRLLNISHCDKLEADCGKTIPDSIQTIYARFSNFNGLGLADKLQLEELNISNNDNLAPNFLQELPLNLHSLWADHTNLTSLKGLIAPNLQKLSVNDCDIKDGSDKINLLQLSLLQNQR